MGRAVASAANTAAGLLASVMLGLAALAATAGAAQARWLKAETEHFVVYSDTHEKLLRDYAVELEQFDALLRLRHGRKPGEPVARKLPIFLVDDLRDLRRMRPESSEGIAGFYFSSHQDVHAAAIRDSGDETLRHEYVHHFMLAEFPTAYPTWLIEGYAEYFMTAEFKPGEATFGKPNRWRTSALFQDRWLPLADPLRKRPSDWRAAGASTQYYAQAWLLTHYMLSDPARLTALQAYARAVAQGADPATALEKATGRPLAALEQALRSYLKGGIKFGRIPREQLGRPEAKVSVMPPSADDLLLEAQLLKRGSIPADQKDDFLRKVRAQAARHPGDRLAELTLAHAEIRLGDRAAGEAILTRRIAADPKDVEALRLLAGSRMEAAEKEKDPQLRARMRTEARRHAARAMNVDQSEYQTLLTFAMSRKEEPGFPTDDDLAALLLAQQLAPQVDDIRLVTAGALAAKGQFREAARLVQPVANDPHGGDSAEQARKLIALAMAGLEAQAKAVKPAGGRPR